MEPQRQKERAQRLAQISARLERAWSKATMNLQDHIQHLEDHGGNVVICACVFTHLLLLFHVTRRMKCDMLQQVGFLKSTG